ncbi:MAG TPA: NAD(P)/FAD-dependent oxidoreductase [Nocardioides sp.]|uniref:NAD(P)/FAD-dependent oxidoreductase n=1 Tax=uncultured Nocardioides sp. TaxID=198441 RepID=UPI000ED89514|nr:NAD(P)/FAD-dependent oxidoreductase [uncultured Nocardioides sp.]HCB07674.1 NAD(P)/FAD-dependent oxidoreductase [Nocardioides sp.]HRI99123.1 NAD(P)/FAD-dependent oxidoreductase [Nocardioides sp.]
MNEQYDAVVIGGGPAGLQATLTLARVHRRVLMVDSGSYRNDPAGHMHNVVTHDGTPPAEFRAAARKELAAYDTATVRDAAVSSIAVQGAGFRVALGDETVEARGVVLATGVADVLPDKPGLAELFGSVVAHCPFCHGHEFAGGHVGVLGVAGAGHLPGLVGPIASRVTVFTDGEELSVELPSAVAVRREPVTGICPSPVGATVSFADGPSEEVAGLFVSTTLRQRAPFAEQLGLALNPSGCVEIDVMGRTSVPGVHAAGDMAHVAALPMPMASVVTAAASGQLAAASLVALL